MENFLRFMTFSNASKRDRGLDEEVCDKKRHSVKIVGENVKVFKLYESKTLLAEILCTGLIFFGQIQN